MLSNSIYHTDNPECQQIDHPIMFMISHKNGINLFSQKLDNSLNLDPQLISGGLNAFSEFISEIFIIKEKIDKIVFNNYCIYIANIDELTIYYIFSGNEETSLEKLILFISEITQLDAWNELNEKSYQITSNQIQILQELVRMVF